MPRVFEINGMNFSGEKARATKVWFADNSMWVSLEDGRIIAIPLAWFPVLEKADEAQLTKYEFSGGGIGIHWDELDEDIYVPNLLLGYGAFKKETVI